MSAASAPDSAPSTPSSPLRSQRAIRFFGRSYLFLKGWCYVPAGLLLLAGIAAMALGWPTWLSPAGGLVATVVSIAITAPWAWFMHQRYDDRYGRVRSPDDGIGRGLWDNAAVSAPLFMGTLLLAFAWIAVCFIYIPEHTPVADNHALPLFAGYALVLQSLQAPDRTTRAVYTVGALSLVAATLLPLVHPAPQTVAVVNYGMLGAVVASVGLYNHRLLTQTFGASERLAPGKSVPESARLALLTALSSCGKATPTFLQNATGLSKGSLSTSLSALKDQGIVDIETTFDGTTRVAYAFITEPGRRTLARCADEHPSLREAVMDLEKAT